MENNFCSHFHFKSLPPQENRRERERQHGREIALAPQHRRRRDQFTSKSSDEPRKPKTELVCRAMPKSSDRKPISQIVELVRRTHSSDRRARPSNHSSDRRARPSSNPFVTDGREPETHHSSNPRSSRRIADLLALGQSSSGGVGGSCFVVL